MRKALSIHVAITKDDRDGKPGRRDVSTFPGRNGAIIYMERWKD